MTFIPKMSTNNYREERKRGLVMISVFIRKLKRGFSALAAIRGTDRCNFSDEEPELEVSSAKVPEDVKEGHFAVFAVKGTEKKRFVVELGYLSCPAFLSLLEQAKEEYGFRQKGALAVPCRPEELQKILQDRRECNLTVIGGQ